MKSRQGSAIVEAALIFPLIILISAAFISTAAEKYAAVRESSLAHRQQALDTLQGKSVLSGDFNWNAVKNEEGLLAKFSALQQGLGGNAEGVLKVRWLTK